MWLDRLFLLYRTIRSGGVNVPGRSAFNFVGLTVTDDPVNDQTTITGGGASAGTLTTASFVVPSYLNSVQISVSDSSAFVNATGLFVAGVGTFGIVSVDSSLLITISGLDSDSPGAGNTVASGTAVVQSGPTIAIVRTNLSVGNLWNFDSSGYFISNSNPFFSPNVVVGVDPPSVVTNTTGMLYLETVGGTSPVAPVSGYNTLYVEGGVLKIWFSGDMAPKTVTAV